MPPADIRARTSDTARQLWTRSLTDATIPHRAGRRKRSVHPPARRPNEVRNLTERQLEVLDFIRGYVREHGASPSRPEIAVALSLKNKSTIDAHLLALMRKGWIELQTGSPRNIRLLKDDLPLAVAGPIAAGVPILAEDRVTARIPRAIAECFACTPDYFLRVQGDSMNRLGLVTGTVVAIKAQSVAKHRDIIVARLEDEVTLKRYVQKQHRCIELRPESTNPNHQPLHIDPTRDQFYVAGIAVGALIGDGFNQPQHELWAA